MRRGVPLILLALLALPAAAPLARERLVEACEVAVAVHARDITLRFGAARASEGRIELQFSFVGTGGNSHQGIASCGFREATETSPPSLDHLEVMGRQGAGMFLKSHHAVWQHFTAPHMTLLGPQIERAPDERPPERERRRKPRQPIA